MEEINTTTTPTDSDPLTPLAEYRKSGRAPVEMNHLIFFNKQSLESSGAIVRYGRRWLVSEGHLMQWLRKHGKKAGRPS